jgi:hypothetical protein
VGILVKNKGGNMETEKKQDIFIEDVDFNSKAALSDSNPLIEKFYNDMDTVFGVTEGVQEAGKFGKKVSRRDNDYPY